MLLRETIEAEREDAARKPAPAAARQPPQATVLALQRSAGNAAVSRMLQRDPDPAAPAAAGGGSNAQWEADWENPAYADSRAKFAGDGRPAGTPHERYLILAPLYKQKGIDRPLKWAHENIVTATFFGRSTPAHVDLKTALEAAEKALRAKGITERPFGSCWAFNPRTTSTGAWSNHADGRAIDIDADTNPHLTSKNERKIITLVTGMDIAAENKGADAYEHAMEMSDAFQDNYSAEGMQDKIDELKEEEEALAEEAAEIKAELAGVPAPPKAKKGKRLTKDEAEQAKASAAMTKEITGRLKAKQAELKAKQGDTTTLTKEKKRFEGLEAKTAKLKEQIETLLGEIPGVQDSIDQLAARIDEEAKKPPDPAPAGEKPKDKRAREKAERARKAADKAQLRKLKGDLKAKQKAVAKAQGAMDPLARYADEGFVNLDEDLVGALTAAGLSWGGTWAGAKDFMHFDVK